MNKSYSAEIISIGTELLLGEIIDTNAAYIAEKLSQRGIFVYRKNTVGDNLQRLCDTIRQALERADILILGGGLGPTEDDLTREAIAEVFSETPYVEEGLLNNLKQMFASRNRVMPESNIKQAWLIKSAEALGNPVGTACGWCVRNSGKMIFALPGPPSEMKKMWLEQVEKRLPESQQHFFQTTIHTSGIGEAQLAEKIADYTKLQSPGIGTYARDNGVDVRVAAVSDSISDAENKVAPVAAKIELLLNPSVYGRDDETIVSAIMKLLLKKKQSFCCIESITGGAIASEITDCPGISSCFKGSVTTYCNEAKVKFGVNQKLLDEYGPVSSQVAEAMAGCAREVFGSDWAVSTTGVAGPDGHGGMKPGTAWVAVAGPGGITSRLLDWPGNREMVKRRVRRSALQMLWDILRSEDTV